MDQLPENFPIFYRKPVSGVRTQENVRAPSILDRLHNRIASAKIKDSCRISVPGAGRIDESRKGDYGVKVCHSFVLSLLHWRNPANECVEMPVIMDAVDVVVCRLTSLLDVLSEFLIESFNPNVVAQFKAGVTIPHNQRGRLVLIHGWPHSDVQDDVAGLRQ
jgi:hypothetical protein